MQKVNRSLAMGRLPHHLSVRPLVVTLTANEHSRRFEHDGVNSLPGKVLIPQYQGILRIFLSTMGRNPI